MGRWSGGELQVPKDHLNADYIPSLYFSLRCCSLPLVQLFPYASVNGITLGVYASHTETALYPGPGPPTFARFVLDEAARTLVTVGQQATGGGLSCSAASGGERCSVSDSTMPAAPLPPARWSMTVRGAGAAGTPYGALTVGEVIDLPMPIGWVPAPEVASVVALPPGPPTSPADFGGFDGSVRQLLGDAVTRRGARSHPYPPTVVTASLPVPFAAVSMTVPAAPPSIFPDAPPPISLVPAFYRLPGPAGARLEVALVQATLTSAVPTLNWSAPSLPSSETLPLPGGDIGLASLAAPRRLRTPRRAADEPDRASRRWAQQMRNRVAAARCNEVARKRRLAAKAAATAAAAAAAEDTTKNKDKEEGAVGGSKGGVHTETGQKATSDASTGTQRDNRESRRVQGVHFGVMHD